MTENNDMEGLDQTSSPEPKNRIDNPNKPSPAGRIIFLIITAICFVYLIIG